MASRKVSRKTSTTQRRANLLKSVTGLFRLGPQTMTQVNKLTGRTSMNRYFIVRNDLREILQGKVSDNMIKTFYHGSNGVTRFLVNNDVDRLSIGCQTFTGKAADALKAWAFKG